MELSRWVFDVWLFWEWEAMTKVLITDCPMNEQFVTGRDSTHFVVILYEGKWNWPQENDGNFFGGRNFESGAWNRYINPKVLHFRQKYMSIVSQLLFKIWSLDGAQSLGLQLGRKNILVLNWRLLWSFHIKSMLYEKLLAIPCIRSFGPIQR